MFGVSSFASQISHVLVYLSTAATLQGKVAQWLFQQNVAIIRPAMNMVAKDTEELRDEAPEVALLVLA